MVRILSFLIIIFFSYPSLAEVITVEGTYKHTEDMSPKDGCMMAKQRAELKAREKITEANQA